MAAPDLYKNFVGTWVGTCCDFPGSKDPVLPVQIVITVEKNGETMRWEYTYGTKGQKGFDRDTRFVALDPARSVITLQWKHTEKESYRARGLDQFAQTGLGTISGANLDPKQRLVYHVIFDLEPASFTYKWLTTSDGKSYTLMGLFKLARVGTAGLKSN